MKKQIRTITSGTLRYAAAFLLLLLLTFSISTNAHAATKLSVTIKSVTKISQTNAQINAKINNPSRMRLRKCGFQLYKASGNKYYLIATRYDSINYTLKSFNAWFDMNQYYGKLTAGTTYGYRFFLVDNSGKTYYTKVYSFKTTAPPKKQSVISKTVSKVVSKVKAASTSKKLSYNQSQIKQIGPQPKKSSYCSVYAMAYARVVAGKGVSNPLSFWGSGGAYWGRGGMTSNRCASQQAALKRCYDEINKGKPAIIYVYDAKNAKVGHYVTVIGYQNVKNPDALTTSNFIVIDPGFGYELNMGRYSQVKKIVNKNGTYYQVVTI